MRKGQAAKGHYLWEQCPAPGSPLALEDLPDLAKTLGQDRAREATFGVGL